MNNIGQDLMGLYKETKRQVLNIFNYIIMISSSLVGIMELYKIYIGTTDRFQSPLFVCNILLDISISLLLIMLGILVPILYNKKKIKIYKISLFILLLIWLYLLMFFIFIFALGKGNFTWIMAVDIIILIMYSIKISE